MYPFEIGSKIVVAATSGGGKTSWAMKLIKFRKEMFPEEPPEKIMICYVVFQKLYREIQKEIPEIIFKYGLPTKEELLELSGEGEVKHSLLLIDDLMSELSNSKEMEELFVTLAHHRKITCLFLTQNVFYQGKYSRTISLNTWYFVILSVRRDIRQLKLLGSQILGGGGTTKAFIKAYEDTQKEKYGYLLVDVSPHSVKKHMLRTNIFPDDPPTIIYVLRE